MTAWLSVVGVGEDGLTGLGRRARRLIDAAEALAGGRRHLAMVPDDGRPRLEWPSPPQAGLAALLAWRPKPVCVLATGDPMHYGVGAVLAGHVTADELTVVPAPDAFALACAALAWPRDGVVALTLHGNAPERRVESLGLHLHPEARLIVLCRDGSTPPAVADFLSTQGFGASRMTVLERMGGPRARRLEARADAWPPEETRGEPVADLVTLAIECEGGEGRSRAPGLPDDVWEHDGQLTKREVRAATLAALAPTPGALLWDVGAGAGSVAIEWLRVDRRCRAIAVERDPQRRARILRNAAALGAPRLEVAPGAAPAALAGLEAPDAVFIGGGVADDAVWEACWKALRPHGRLVANAVTIHSEARLLARHARHGGALSRIAVSRAEPMGGGLAWRALRPVTQLTQTRP